MLCGVSSGRSPSSNPNSYQRPSCNEGLFSHSQQHQPAESDPGCHSLARVLLCGVRKLASESWPLQLACAITSTAIFRGEYISPHLQSLRLVHLSIIFYNYCWCQLYNQTMTNYFSEWKGRESQGWRCYEMCERNLLQTWFHLVTTVMNSHGVFLHPPPHHGHLYSFRASQQRLN